MIDFMLEHPNDLLPGYEWDWAAFGYPVDPLTVDRVALWAFRGDPQLGVGLTAILAGTLGWLNTAKTTQVINPTIFQANPVQRTPQMTFVNPSNTYPFVIETIARVWGELTDDSLVVHFQAANGERTDRTLSGDLPAIVSQLLDLSIEIQQWLGITEPRQPDEPLDLHDPALLTDFVRAWGEIVIAAQFMPIGEPDFVQEVARSIEQLESATLVGSRFACWGACHALSTVTAQANPIDDEQDHIIDQAQGVLVNLGTLFPKVAWPSILLGILALEAEDLDQAIALFESAVESDPLARIGWRLLIALYGLDNQYQQAITAFEETIAGALVDGPLYYQIGKLYYDMFLASEADNEDDDDQDHIQSNGKVGKGTAGKGKQAARSEAETLAAEIDLLKHVQESFLNADQMHFHQPEMYALLVDVAQGLSDTDLLWMAFRSLAETDLLGTWLLDTIAYMEAFGDFEPGLTILREVSAHHPDRFAPAMAYTLALIDLDQQAEAEATIPALRALATTDSERSEVASVALAAADPEFADNFDALDDELAAGQVADSGAISYLTEIVSREPQFGEAVIALATAYESREEIDSALAVLDAGRQQLPDLAELLLSQADILWGDDRDEEAVTLLKTALNQPKPSGAIIARLSEYYLMSNDPLQALVYLNTALLIDPYDEEVERVSDQVVSEMEDGLASGLFDDDDEDYEDDEDYNENEG